MTKRAIRRPKAIDLSRALAFAAAAARGDDTLELMWDEAVAEHRALMLALALSALLRQPDLMAQIGDLASPSAMARVNAVIEALTALEADGPDEDDDRDDDGEDDYPR